MRFNFTPLYLTVPIAVIIELVIPISLGYYFIRRYRTSWKLFIFGMLMYVAAQLVRIPLLVLITNLVPKYKPGEESIPVFLQLLISAVVLGLVVGIAEEIARWAGFTTLGDRGKSWGAAITLGVGQGALESLIAGSQALTNYVFMVNLRENGLGETKLKPDEVKNLMAQVSSYWDRVWHAPIADSIVYLCLMVLAVTLSVIVWQSIVTNSKKLFLMAVGWHTLVYTVFVLLVSLDWNRWLVNLILLVFAGINLYTLRWYYQKPEVSATVEPL